MDADSCCFTFSNADASLCLSSSKIIEKQVSPSNSSVGAPSSILPALFTFKNTPFKSIVK